MGHKMSSEMKGVCDCVCLTYNCAVIHVLFSYNIYTLLLIENMLGHFNNLLSVCKLVCAPWPAVPYLVQTIFHLYVDQVLAGLIVLASV